MTTSLGKAEDGLDCTNPFLALVPVPLGETVGTTSSTLHVALLQACEGVNESLADWFRDLIVFKLLLKDASLIHSVIENLLVLFTSLVDAQDSVKNLVCLLAFLLRDVALSG